LTPEQLQKKTEMEERRKAHINRLADQQKREVVEKILNVGSDETGKPGQARQGERGSRPEREDPDRAAEASRGSLC